MAFATLDLVSSDAPLANKRAPTPPAPTPCLRKGLSLTNTAAERNSAATHASHPSPLPAARISGVAPVSSPTLAAGRSPRGTYRGLSRSLEGDDDLEPEASLERRGCVPIVPSGVSRRNAFPETRSRASSAARAAVAGSAVSSNPPGGASPSASSASHTHRASPASFSAAECSSVPPSPRGDRGQRRVELNGGGCANASPRTERIVAAASASPRARETCSAFPISSVEARGRRDGFAAECASSRAPRVHGPPRSARRHFHARAAHARFRSARRDGIEPPPTSAAYERESDSGSAIASRNVSSSSARNAALKRAWGVAWYSRDSSSEPPRRPAGSTPPGFSGGAGARFPPADAQ